LSSVSEALSGAQQLQFESTSGWSPGGTTLATSTSIKTQGTASLRVTTPNTWHEISASNLSSVGAVGSKLGLDVRINKSHGWGEIRAVVSIPSQQVWDQDLGAVSVAGRPVNTFFRVEYGLPASLQTKLAASYSDLTIRFRISAPAAVYHFDNGGFAPSVGPITSADIGDTGATGSTSSSNGVYTIRGAGSDIEYSSDSFRFLYRSLDGDGQVVARIQDVTETNTWTKVGLMVRDSLATNAKNGFMFLRPSQGSGFQYRDATGGGTMSSFQDEPADWSPEINARYLKAPKWLKLTRKGNTLTAYSSDDGQCWWQRWTQPLTFDDNQLFFGVALTSTSHGNLATAHVSDFAVATAIEPHNAACPRSQVDGDLPVPSSFIVAPGRFGGSSWSYTTANPNGSVPVVKCDPNAEDAPNETPARRTDGPDHPNCPNPTASPAWTQLGYSPGGSWQLNKPMGIGFAPAHSSDVLATSVNSRGIWLRKTFTLSSQAQKNELMFWGRWGDGISVYVNGVLASSNSDSTHEYKYVGLSDEARAALVVGGNNVVAVRLEWEEYFWSGNQVVQGDHWDRFVDLGITTEGRLAAVPVQRLLEPNQELTAYVNTFKEFMQEQGMSGATLAVSKDDVLVASAGLGWHNRNLNVPMPRGANLRLASNDKVITHAAIAKLVNEGVIAPATPVFPLLDLDPVPGRSKGANVDSITVDHLRTHTSGIGEPPHEQWVADELSMDFGVQTSQLTSEHFARLLYSLDATDVGGESRYSSNGYFLLRHLVERLVAPKTLDEYLAEDMGLTGIRVCHEAMAAREPNEGYITRQPTWDRWFALENFLALGASAEGYTSFFNDFALWYELSPDGLGYQPGGGGIGGGAMAGTWSIAMSDPSRAFSLVMISNNHGHFDEAIARMDKITYEGSPCLFGPQDPRTRLERFHFIRNLASQTRYINVENGLAASPATAGNWSAGWTLEQVDPNHYRFLNRWTGEYLHMQGSTLLTGYPDPNLTTTQWMLVYVGGSFYLQNRGTGRYLRVTNGALTTSTTASDNAALWDFCN
jgi:CubicO group peptidase (beta-lactamase class C family)